MCSRWPPEQDLAGVWKNHYSSTPFLTEVSLTVIAVVSLWPYANITLLTYHFLSLSECNHIEFFVITDFFW